MFSGGLNSDDENDKDLKKVWVTESSHWID